MNHRWYLVNRIHRNSVMEIPLQFRWCVFKKSFLFLNAKTLKNSALNIDLCHNTSVEFTLWIYLYDEYWKPTFIREDNNSWYTVLKWVSGRPIFKRRFYLDPCSFLQPCDIGWFAGINSSEDKTLANLAPE